MKQTTFIYCLTEPGTKTIRYFGKTNNPKKRLPKHLLDARSGALDYYSSRWIRTLQADGLSPTMHVLCVVPKDDWERFERAFIFLGKQHGFRLTNATAGGEAGPSTKGRKKPEGHGKKVSAALRGKKKSDAHRLNLSIARFGSKDRDASSKFRGVVFSGFGDGRPHNRPWRAGIYLGNRKVKFIGHFLSEMDAAKAYDEEAKKHFGKAAKLNFPNE